MVKLIGINLLISAYLLYRAFKQETLSLKGCILLWLTETLFFLLITLGLYLILF